MLAKSMIFSAVLLGTFLYSPKPSGLTQVAVTTVAANESTLYCGPSNPARECSYVLWDGHGSRGVVVPANTETPIGNSYLGFKWCMHAATPRAPMPNWPACWKDDGRKGWTLIDAYGVINPGTNGR